MSYSAIIDYPSLRNIDALNTGSMRFNFSNLFCSKSPQIAKTIPDATFVQFIQAWNLALRGRDDNLPADVIGDIVFLAKLNKFPSPFDTEPSLETSGFVINPGVDNPAIVACLVSGYRRFLLQNGYRNPRKTPSQFKARCQADNAGANNCDFDLG